MTDQNIATNGNNTLPAQPVGETILPVEPSISASSDVPSVPPGIIPQATDINIPPSPTMVIASGNNGGVPKWFYFIFGITVIVFFLVTALLILQFTQKQKADIGTAPTVTPKVPTVSIPISNITPVVSAADSAAVKFNDVGKSDDTTSIEADLKNTDLMVLDQSLNEVDTQMNSTP